jgi:hypothetical protein
MNNTFDNAVYKYRNSIFMDLTMGEPTNIPIVMNVTQYIPLNSINTGFKMVPYLDLFSLMNIDNALSFEKNWLVFLAVLNLTCVISQGKIKPNCLLQCQTLKLQLDDYSVH